MNSEKTPPAKTQIGSKIGLWQVVALAVGTMVGASIFSIFGLGARVAGHNLPLVFVLAGAVAFFVAYSYATLGRCIVSDAGPMEFILRGLGDGLIAGSLSILFWLTYVVSIALFAKGFAGYLLPMLPFTASPWATGILEVTVVLVFMALGVLGSTTVGKAEFGIVLVKLGILGLFVVLGIGSINIDWVSPQIDEAHLNQTVNAVAIFFLSYMGFGLVTNASENMIDPQRNVPRAIYISIIIVTVVYVSVALVAVGNLPLSEIIKARDNALAEAAKPFLGNSGFLLVSYGALFSIASALNATLYGGANVAYALARDGELPTRFERKLWFGSTEGLYITAGLGMVFALLFNLNGIATVTSSVFMVIYMFVLISHWRLRDKYGGNAVIITCGFFLVLAVFSQLLHYQWQTNRTAFYGTWVVLGGSWLVELIYRGITKRNLLIREFDLIEQELKEMEEAALRYLHPRTNKNKPSD